MGPKHNFDIRVIDFSKQDLKPGSPPEWDFVKSQVRQALEGYGMAASRHCLIRLHWSFGMLYLEA
ncbi:2-oxoglutarate (2OG) and Fe(II)-dependent oxygenase-like protein [Corchorus olitorius]|uniref:2-oxoglutarate (2OG) and Fe(II)-dependent oxygenase-like protein n=1 Tax=Corchorus olitorius TaxID=93759 RepID=A0A1R3HSJ4_9ROSI|nr:2-oxoglutarate (2OG) and Fe(II)-dependent oxygenase-like protein [Corchorus olitorius]